MKVPRVRFLFEGKLLRIVLGGAFVALVVGWAFFAFSGTPARLPFYFTTAALLGMLIVIFGFDRLQMRPSKELLKASLTLGEKDLPDLKVALAELSQGNLATRLGVKTRPIPLRFGEGFSELVQNMNRMIEQLQETAAEFNNLTETPCLRLCYVGADSFLEGQKCGEVMAEAIGGKGEVVIISGSFQHSGLELRRKGFESYVRQHFPGIAIVDLHETHEDMENAYRHSLEALKRFPHLAGIYVTDGATPPGVARAVVDAGRKGQVKIVGHDLTDATMRFLVDGVITATLGQDPFAQGHDPLIHLYNHLVAGWEPPVPRLLTRMDVITRENYRDFWQEGRGMIQTQASLARLAAPLPNPQGKTFRLVMLGHEASDFWIPVREGAMCAIEKLKPFGCTAEWIVPEESRLSHTFDFKAFAREIEKAIEESVHGIAMVGANNTLIPLINRAVKQGIPVILANNEPSSLRSLIFTITRQANTLMEMSQTLASSTYEISVAIDQINTAVGDVAGGIVSQNEGVSQTRESLASLLAHIDRVSREAGKSAKAAEETAHAVEAGTGAMRETLKSMKSIESSVNETWEIVQQLGRHSDQIDQIIDLIDDIASRVNILSLNAAIEATKAGDYGRGFMVVANEIRKLAKNTADATRQVTDLVSAVKVSIGQVEKMMTSSLKRVKKSAEMTDQAGEALAQIRNLVEIDQQRLQTIAVSIADMQQFSHRVGTAMDAVASVSEKNALAVESVNVSTSEMRTQIKEATSLAQRLERLARGEQEMLAKFTVSMNDHT